MDFGLGFIPHPSPILEFRGGLPHVAEEFSEENPKPGEHSPWVWSLASFAFQKP